MTTVREPGVQGLTLTTVLATTERATVIDFANYILRVPAGASSISVDVYHGYEEDGTYQQLVDADGTDVSITIAAGKDYVLPPATFAAHYVKLVTDADDSSLQFQLIAKT